MITSKEMAFWEEWAEKHGVKKGQLMETAGKNLAFEIKKRVSKGKKILFLCLHGNNGGDGFVCARYLVEDYKVEVLFLGNKNKLTPEAKKNYERLPETFFVTNPSLGKYDCIVDALLGTGKKGELREQLRILCKKYNASKAFKVAVDIPTGINPDTGSHKTWFKADLIITLHAMKKGLAKLKDKTIVIDIGIPNKP